MKPKTFSPLHKATYEGNVEAVKTLIDVNNVPVNICTERNENVIHYAMCHGQKAIIKPLVERGVNVNKQTYSGLTPIVMAVLNDHIDCLIELIQVCKELGVALDINKGSTQGEQAIHHAAGQHKFEALKILVENGADVNASICDGSKPLDLASAPVQEHHHHHHHHGETCNHDHGNTDKQKEDRLKCIDYIKEHGGTEGEPVEPAQYGVTDGPAFVGRGFSNDQVMMVHEQRFGGALWGDYIQVFYSGKKPKVGYALEIRLLIDPQVTGQKVAVVHGFIHTVSDDKKTIVATVKLTGDFANKVQKLDGEWEATLELKTGDLVPWVLVKLQPQQDTTKSFAALLQMAKEKEQTEGRKFQKVPDVETPSWVLKGTEEANTAQKVLIGVNVVGGIELVYHFEDGTTESAKGSRLPYLFQHIVEQNTELLQEGKEGIFIRVDGRDVEFAHDDDEHEHHEGCNHDHDHDHHHHHHEHHEGCNHDHDHDHDHHHNH
jgi:hypothetical protein